MQIIVNGETVETKPVASLQEFLNQHESLPAQFAIAVNGAFVAQASYAATALKEGDDIELLVPMQGG